MAAIYPYVLIVHLFCAVIFIGYLFFDVVILPNVKKLYGEEVANKAEQGIGQRAVKIMPICVLLLLITGGMMVSQYIGGDKGYFETPFQKVLMLKICFACGIFAMVGIALTCKFLNKKNPIGNIIHPAVLILGALIIVCAKLMWYV
ncbi:Translocation protein, low temperature [Helicobacter sp. NHP19-012]|uniref:Translocation protein, low temperature n=1 Tax=Helicobacter gastrofelis TaxID=2849642 RepID=A0ABN6I788_9HELI|nr:MULTISPECIES: CopD family copper resistance protein [unclassified Helicobacter]BCZ18454.1 Translocation protein, low temperature [Helicobacter sp. NHP19-012]GMB95732.1 Translocation protein, low temperature [Helicobacter sp. NHP22-001]